MSHPPNLSPDSSSEIVATRLLRVATRVLGLAAAVLILFLAVGTALPGTWTVQRSIGIEASSAEIFALLSNLDRWEEWTPWPEVDLIRSGPSSGLGAQMSWDDPFAGDGVFRIVESEPDSLLRYHVAVEGGHITTDGTFHLQPTDGRTRVSWIETGDFGWNPLMAYAALTMNRTQGTELERGLAHLTLRTFCRSARPVPPVGWRNCSRRKERKWAPHI